MISVLKPATICLSLFILLPPSSGHAAPEPSCILSTLVMSDTRHEIYLLRRAAEIASARPDLEEVAALEADVAKTGFMIFNSRRSWLWQTQPDRFTTPETFFGFGLQRRTSPATVSLDRGVPQKPEAYMVWGDDDQAGWLLADASHAALVEHWRDRRRVLDAHPDYLSLEKFWATAAGQKRFLDLALEQSAASHKDREAIAACF